MRTKIPDAPLAMTTREVIEGLTMIDEFPEMKSRPRYALKYLVTNAESVKTANIDELDAIVGLVGKMFREDAGKETST